MTTEYMRGVAVDCTNKPPTWRKLRNAGLQSVRIEMRDLPSFYSYTEELAKRGIQQAWLVGPSTESVRRVLDKATIRPRLVIIGNEPDLVGPSSWTMTVPEYVNMYNREASLVKSVWANMELATAGMYNPAYLWAVMNGLYFKPTYVNRHYPDSLDDIRRFDAIGNKTIVGEWTWRTATQQEMYDWEVNLLEQYTWASFWFCWADYMVPGHGLVTKSGQKTKAYHYLKNVLRRIYVG